MFLALAKRVVAKALNRHFVRLVTDAYRHPHLDSHMRIQRAAQLCYGITRNGFPGRGTSRWFLDRVHQAQLDVFRRGSDLDLRVSPIGHDNLVLLCRSSDANSSVVYLYGFSDNLTSFTLYRQFVRPGSVAIDVGANLGIHSLVLSRCVGDEGSVLAYEPSTPLHERLLRNIDINKASNIVPRKVGLWERSGRIGFEPHVDDFNIGRGKISHGSRQHIAVRTLDEEAEMVDARIDLIKIDVEGAELSVLKGSRNTLSEHKPVVILEFNPDQYRFNDIVAHVPYDASYFRVPYTFWESLAVIEDADFDRRADLMIVPSDRMPPEQCRQRRTGTISASGVQSCQ